MPLTAMALLAVRDLTLTLDGRRILEGVSFDLMPGEFVSLVGPNGAGKTTLLRCLMRIHTRWTGEVLWEGTPIDRFSSRRWARRVAYLPQEDRVSVPYSVEEFVLMARYPHGNPFLPPSPADLEAVRKALLVTDTWSWRHRIVRTLSGGERQRVMLAAVLAQEARVLLLDEATTFLDYHHREDVQALLKKINRREGITILAVTHDVNAAALVSDRIIALQNGRIVFIGPPRELMQAAVLHRLFGFHPVLVPHPQVGLPVVVPALPGGDT